MTRRIGRMKKRGSRGMASGLSVHSDNPAMHQQQAPMLTQGFNTQAQQQAPMLNQGFRFGKAPPQAPYDVEAHCKSLCANPGSGPGFDTCKPGGACDWILLGQKGPSTDLSAGSPSRPKPRPGRKARVKKRTSGRRRSRRNRR